MTDFKSQAAQDQFVFKMLVEPEKLTNGTFLDIGCNAPEHWNNTYCLEKIGWSGIAFDGDVNCMKGWENRKTPFVLADATEVDFSYFGIKSVDYLSLDVDFATLPTLKNLLNHGIKFRVATIEHDSYQFGNGPRDEIRKLLLAEGYEILCEDVCNPVPFEDFWIDPKRVNMEVAKKFECKMKQAFDIVK